MQAWLVKRLIDYLLPIVVNWLLEKLAEEAKKKGPGIPVDPVLKDNPVSLSSRER